MSTSPGTPHLTIASDSLGWDPGLGTGSFENHSSTLRDSWTFFFFLSVCVIDHKMVPSFYKIFDVHQTGNNPFSPESERTELNFNNLHSISLG